LPLSTQAQAQLLPSIGAEENLLKGSSHKIKQIGQEN
jgi:hypothetical protein